MSYSPHLTLPYGEFRQACRAFKPSILVPALARLSASQGEPPYSNTVKQRLPPWGIAAAARESLVWGNEHRDKPADARNLRRLLHIFNLAGDVPPESELGPDFLVRLMTRFTYEQFPWQESMFEELARSHAWLLGGLPDVSTEVMTEDSLAAVLGGMPLRDAIGATFFLQVGVFQNGGIYDPGWLEQPHFADVLALYPKANIEAIAARLTTDVSGFRDDFAAFSVGTPTLARFDYNPLVKTPFIQLDDGPPVAPAARLVLRTVTPSGLYYAGIAVYGTAFARDLGVLFEHYIGRQFKLIHGADVHPEIVYGKSGEKSVDWFVVMPGLVLLVEVKSRRLGPAARAGDPSLFDALDDSLQRARKQLTRTIEKLASGHSAFSHIPTDRPMLALIVTAEPFYTGAAYLLDHDTAIISGGTLDDIPVTTASARDIEWLMTHGSDLEGLLLERMNSRGEGVVDVSTIGKKTGVENPVLLDAWESYPWPPKDEGETAGQAPT